MVVRRIHIELKDDDATTFEATKKLVGLGLSNPKTVLYLIKFYKEHKHG